MLGSIAISAIVAAIVFIVSMIVLSALKIGVHLKFTDVIGPLIAVIAVALSAYTLFQSQRSWVSVEAINALSMPNFDKGYFDFTFEIAMTNSGNGLANDIRIKAVVLPAASGSGSDAFLEQNWDRARAVVEQEIRDNKQDWPIGYVLAPKQVTKIPHPGASHDVTAEQMKAGKYVITGYISYSDQFGASHSTRFAFRPDVPSHGELSPAHLPTFVPDGRFSKAD